MKRMSSIEVSIRLIWAFVVDLGMWTFVVDLGMWINWLSWLLIQFSSCWSVGWIGSSRLWIDLEIISDELSDLSDSKNKITYTEVPIWEFISFSINWDFCWLFYFIFWFGYVSFVVDLLVLVSWVIWLIIDLVLVNSIGWNGIVDWFRINLWWMEWLVFRGTMCLVFMDFETGLSLDTIRVVLMDSENGFSIISLCIYIHIHI